MGKYSNIDMGKHDDVDLLRIIANELAEMNRLKREEIMLKHYYTERGKSEILNDLEDEA